MRINNNLNNEKFINCLENIVNIINNYIQNEIYIYKCVYFFEQLNLSIIKFIYDIGDKRFM